MSVTAVAPLGIGPEAVVCRALIPLLKVPVLLVLLVPLEVLVGPCPVNDAVCAVLTAASHVSRVVYSEGVAAATTGARRCTPAVAQWVPRQRREEGQATDGCRERAGGPTWHLDQCFGEYWYSNAGIWSFVNRVE